MCVCVAYGIWLCMAARTEVGGGGGLSPLFSRAIDGFFDFFEEFSKVPCQRGLQENGKVCVMGGSVNTFFSTEAELFGISRFAWVFQRSPAKSPKSPRATPKVCSQSANSPSPRSSKKSPRPTIWTSPSPKRFKLGYELPEIHLQLHTYGARMHLLLFVAPSPVVFGEILKQMAPILWS